MVHRLNDRLDGDEVRAGDRIVLHWAAEHSFVIGSRTAGNGAGAKEEQGAAAVGAVRETEEA